MGFRLDTLITLLAGLLALGLLAVPQAQAGYTDVVKAEPSLQAYWPLDEPDINETMTGGYDSARFWEYGTLDFSSNTLKFAPDMNWGGIGLWNPYPLQNSSVVMEIPTPLSGNRASSGQDIWMYPDTGAPWEDDSLAIRIHGVAAGSSPLYILNQDVVNGNTSQNLGTYNPVSMRWLRIRGDMDTMYVDTSPDGSSWTNRGSLFLGDRMKRRYQFSMESGTWAPGGPAALPNIEYDNFRTDFSASDRMYTVTGSYHGAVSRGQAGIPDADWFSGSTRFDGANSWVAFSDVHDRSGTAPMSLEAWVRPERTDHPKDQVILDKTDAGGNGWSLRMTPGQSGGAGGFSFARSDDGVALGQVKTPAGWQARAGFWYHVVATFDGSQYRLYVNDELQDSFNGSGNLDNTSADVRVGRHSTIATDNGLNFQGNIAETAIYDAPLSSGSVHDHWEAGRDKTPPTVNVGGGLADGTVTLDRSSVSYTLASPDPDLVELQCQINGGAWNPCSGTYTFPGSLADGNYTLQVRALDLHGNYTASPASRSFQVIDLDTSFTMNPEQFSNSTQAEFRFLSSPDAIAFECRLDAGAWQTCTSPYVITDLSEGEHQIQVRALGPAALVGPAESFQWTVDLSQPTLRTEDVLPRRYSYGSGPLIMLQPSEEIGRYECKIDQADWSQCANPVALIGLAPGEHRILIRAFDRAGNQQDQPVEYVFTIDPNTARVKTPFALSLQNRELACSGAWLNASEVQTSYVWKRQGVRLDQQASRIRADRNGRYDCLVSGSAVSSAGPVSMTASGTLLRGGLLANLTLSGKRLRFDTSRRMLAQVTVSRDGKRIFTRRTKTGSGTNLFLLPRRARTGDVVSVRAVDRISVMRRTGESLQATIVTA